MCDSSGAVAIVGVGECRHETIIVHVCAFSRAIFGP